mgnify:FL=1
MGNLLNFITNFHQSTKRNYFERMANEKVECMKVARKFDVDFWDGDRKFGYGGYKYVTDLLKPLAEKIIHHYNLSNSSKILEVGCGKGYLLFEIKKILPELEIVGFDISEYSISNSKKEIKSSLFVHKAEEKYLYKDNEFDLVICINTLHNLQIDKLEKAIFEINRVSKQQYIVVESYRNEKELFNLQCWALTAEAFFSKNEWEWLFKKFGYNGDYEFIYFI